MQTGEGETKIVGEARGPRDLLPLTPTVLNILLTLADRERHGYGIMREVEERSGGEVRPGPGTLHGSIKRMLADGLIEESDERPDPEMDGQRRRYYRVMDFGRRRVGPRPSVWRAWSPRRERKSSFVVRDSGPCLREHDARH
jgi:DNA-binding PadR family transcriptional regulator